MNYHNPAILPIYSFLLEEYGQQGWWPLLGQKGCKPTKTGSITGYHPGNYDLPQTRNQAFEVCLGAILTQNTGWPQVELALKNLHERDCLDPEKILEMESELLKEAIRSAGYFNQKAKKVKIFTHYFLNSLNSLNSPNSLNFLDSLDSLDSPNSLDSLDSLDSLNSPNSPNSLNFSAFDQSRIPTREELLSLWGIGPETADSMLLYAFKVPTFVIDAYTRRIFTRLGIADEKISYDDLKALFEQSLPKDLILYQEYHALIVEHAKRFYQKKSDQQPCPLSQWLRSKQRISGSVSGPISGPISGSISSGEQ